MEPTNNILFSKDTISSIHSICKLTEKYKLQTENEQPIIWYNLSSDLTELSHCPTPQLQKLIDNLQESFVREAQILHNNQMSEEDINHVFISYKEFLLNRYYKYQEYYDHQKQPEFLLTPECTYFSKQDYTDSEFKYQTDDFLFELGSVLSLSSMSVADPANEISNLDYSPLYKTSDFGFGDMIEQEQKQPLKENFSNTNSLLFIDDFDTSAKKQEPVSPAASFFEKKKPNFSRECKGFLEAVFSVKPFPNSVERKMIASRFKLSPVQVRNWFSNKRARQRIKQSKADKQLFSQ